MPRSPSATEMFHTSGFECCCNAVSARASFFILPREMKLAFRKWLRIFSELFFYADTRAEVVSKSKVGCGNFTHCDAIPLRLGIPNKSRAQSAPLVTGDLGRFDD